MSREPVLERLTDADGPGLTAEGNRPTDAELLGLAAGGDRGAFGELFRRMRKDVYRFALHMTGRPEAAEDIVQDTFLVVMREAGRYQPARSSASSWLCGIARNCARQRLDREWRFQPMDETMNEPEGGEVGTSDPLSELTRAEGLARLRNAILKLPLHYREVVVLCDLQEMTYAEAAAALACAVGTVRSRLSRGREMIVRRLTASQEAVARPRLLANARCDR